MQQQPTFLRPNSMELEGETSASAHVSCIHAAFTAYNENAPRHIIINNFPLTGAHFELITNLLQAIVSSGESEAKRLEF